MRAIMVSVDYADLLAITLPYNRHHFEEVWVVTSSADEATVEVARAHGAQVVVTDLFYERGAAFNKWAALEHGLDVMRREGWLCLMDADVLWPKGLTVKGNEGAVLFDCGGCSTGAHGVGTLLTPLRRMWNDFPLLPPDIMVTLFEDGPALPDEACWDRFPIHRNVAEWAGYSQIFHADDPALGKPPWHETDWTSAGAADSFFQAKWSKANKVRPSWECLHLGEAGVNWYGRATPRLDGSTHPQADERRAQVARMWENRKRLRESGQNQFSQERLKK